VLDPSAPPRRLLGAVALLALVAALGGCSDDSARPAGQATTGSAPSSSSSSSSSTPEATEDWQSITDPGTGVHFELPEADPAEPGQRPGQGGVQVTSRRWAATSGDVRLSVNVLTTPSRPAAVRRTVRPQYLPFLVIDTVRSQGAKQAGVVSSSRLRDLPYDGFDSQLTFVQAGRRAVWFTRAVALPRAVVVAQAIAYVPVDEDAVDRVRAEFDRLTDGLVIPSA